MFKIFLTSQVSPVAAGIANDVAPRKDLTLAYITTAFERMDVSLTR